MLSDIQHTAIQAVKGGAEVTSYGLVVGTLLGYLPEIAAGFSIVWICYQLFHAERQRRLINKQKKLVESQQEYIEKELD